MNEFIGKAITIVGSQRKLALTCGLTQQAVYKWLHNKSKVSPQYVECIVKATNGAVQPHELRPDLPTLFPHPTGPDHAA